MNVFMRGVWILVLLLALAGCSKDEATTPADGDQPTDGDGVTDGDLVDGDTPGDGDDSDGDLVPDGDGSADGDDTQDGDMTPDGDDPEDGDAPQPDAPFVFAVISDTHVIDEFYSGREGNDLDTESIYLTNERLVLAREQVNAMQNPAVELVVVPGDYVHNYPSEDWDFYFENVTRFDIVKEIADGFNMPVYPGLGNHDYDIGKIPRDFTHALVKEKWGIDPYYAVDHKGVRFIHLSNFLGETMDPEGEGYNRQIGSFGEEQLDWLEAQLADGLPSFVIFHYPLLLIRRNEFPGRDVLTILQAHKDTVACVFGGHHHRWQDWKIGESHTYGVPHIVAGSTRYSEDNILYVEVDPATGQWTTLNADCIGWGGMYANQYIPGEPCEAPSGK